MVSGVWSLLWFLVFSRNLKAYTVMCFTVESQSWCWKGILNPFFFSGGPAKQSSGDPGVSASDFKQLDLQFNARFQTSVPEMARLPTLDCTKDHLIQKKECIKKSIIHKVLNEETGLFITILYNYCPSLFPRHFTSHLFFSEHFLLSQQEKFTIVLMYPEVLIKNCIPNGRDCTEVRSLGLHPAYPVLIPTPHILPTTIDPLI